MVAREALLMVGAGVLIGGPASLAAARMTRSLLFGVRPEDPAVICFSVASLLAVGVCAGILPARRAAAIDPVQALRTE
jgi:ABC-type antimicrobial peptide transport system permease subunit